MKSAIHPSLLRPMRRGVRLSTIARTLWLMVAALHIYLITRRFAVGDWSTLLDYVRAALCLAGVGYASLKFWRIATIFDSSLRRALTFGLILLLGHWVIAAPSHDAAGAEAARFAALIAVLPVLGATLLGTLQLVRARRRSTPRPARVMAAPAAFELAYLPLLVLRDFPTLYHRPPPCRA